MRETPTFKMNRGLQRRLQRAIFGGTYVRCNMMAREHWSVRVDVKEWRPRKQPVSRWAALEANRVEAAWWAVRRAFLSYVSKRPRAAR